MSPLIIGMALLVGPVILVLCVAIGLLGFSPETAENIRAAENSPHVVVEEVRHIHIREPDTFHHERLDRHPAYLTLHMAVFCYSWCIFAGAPITSNLASLSQQTRMTMAACFVVGSTLVLSGASMGARLGRWRVFRGIHDNITSAKLSDDIRLPYTFGAVGMFAVGTSMAIYASTSFNSTLGSLGGWITAFSAVMCVGMLGMFVNRVRQYEMARKTLINRAVANIELRGDADVAE